jgi:hypothetical protein
VRIGLLALLLCSFTFAVGVPTTPGSQALPLVSTPTSANLTPSADLYRFQWDYFSADYNGLAQTMTSSVDGALMAVDLFMARDDWTAVDLRVHVRQDDPTGTLLATSEPVPAAAINVGPAAWTRFHFSSPVPLDEGDTVAVVTDVPYPLPGGVPAGPAWYWAWSADAYGGGVAWGGSTQPGDPTVSWASWYDGSDLAIRAVMATPDTLLRLGGADRFETAILLSKYSFPDPDSADAVVLSRSDLFPDALAGGPLAATVNGPVLITTPTALRPDILAEINRVLPATGTVYLLGGTGALSSSVQNTLVAAGYSVDRLAGADRFGTALAIAAEVDRLQGQAGVLFVATGRNFPDALAAGAAAASFNQSAGPTTPGSVVLLSNDYVLPTEVADYLTGRYLSDPESVIVAAGGQASGAVASVFGCDSAMGVFCYVGQDRYQTAAWIGYDWYDPKEGFGLSTGENFPDALTGAPVLARHNWPMLLVPPDGPVPSRPDDSVREFLIDHGATLDAGLVLGGPGAVSAIVVQEACALAGVGACDVAFIP